MVRSIPKKVENETQQADLEVGPGEIQDNALKAMVTSRLFKTRVERSKKGKGSFNRKMKHKGKEPYSKEAESCFLLNRAFLSL
ncbi:ribosome alternative rescue factor ArfA [Vibrio sp.]|uniref:alternative ribosome-rescue factor A n=1 Tax=Vibrio sp. TaxID=678 RepID=UPI0031202BEB